MPLRFIIGPSGSGKSHLCLEEIRERLRESPKGPPLIYLVPEQMTFQAEYELVRTPALHGMIRAQVFSFRRLAWKVLQEAGGITRRHINGTGIRMVLRNILERRKEELKLFGRAAGQLGFTAILEELYTEMKRYLVTPEQLLQRAKEFGERAAEPGYRLLADKLHDLSRIFLDLEEYLEGRYTDSEDYLRLLAERIPRSDYIREAEIWIDGFHGFTPQEYAVLTSLLEYGKRVSLALCMDKPAEETDPYDLYYPAKTTYRKMAELARKLGIPTETVDVGGNGRGVSVRFRHPDLAYLERNFAGLATAAPYSGAAEGLALTAAANRRAEVEEAARRILELARERGYRWREMAILVRNMESYRDLIETVFADYGIPVFLDQKRAMFHHPLIELIRSALETVVYGWKPDAVFRCVKTDFFLPPSELAEKERAEWRNRFDQLENYVLSRGIKGERWTDGKMWKISPWKTPDNEPQAWERTEEEERRLNSLRERIAAPLWQLEKDLKGSANVREMCAALFDFLLRLRAPEHLERWSAEAQETHRLERAREHAQVWQAVTGLLDQLVEIMGEERISVERFAKILESGLEGLQFALVPPSLDQVLAGTVGRTRYSNIRATFVLGANEGVLPAAAKEDGLLLETEREMLSRHGVELAPGSKQKLVEEQFLLYTTFASPSEFLYLSYPLADEEGKALLPSGVVKQLKRLFPRLEERLVTLEADGESARYVDRPRKTLSLLAGQLRKLQQGYAVPPFWFEIYNWFIFQPSWKEAAERVLSSLFYRNREGRLKPATARSLYGIRLRASITRLETFQSCPFAHFASYGLKLEERDIYRLEAPDIGRLYHDSLSRLLEIVREERMDPGQLSAEELYLLAARAVDELAPFLQNEILFSSSRYRYIHRKLKNVVGRTAVVLGEHARRSRFVPVAMELPFGPGTALPPLVFRLPNGCIMELVGRIDRVDRAAGPQGALLRIIDYKSGRTRLKLDEVYYGLSLQMLVYLDVLISQAEGWLGTKASPAGILYFRVHNPLLASEHPLTKEEAEKKALKKYRMTGYLLADMETIRLMDTGLTSGRSEILPVGIRGDGQFYSDSKVLTREQLDALRRHVRRVIQAIGTEITDGVVQIAPYRLKKETPCAFCPYKPVCQFDPVFEGENFRPFKPLRPEELWNILFEEGGEGDGGDTGQTGRTELDG